MEPKDSKFPKFVKLNRSLAGIPKGATFERQWDERSFIYVAKGGYTFPDGKSRFWLTGDFVVGDITRPGGGSPRCWTPHMFTEFDYPAKG